MSTIIDLGPSENIESFFDPNRVVKNFSETFRREGERKKIKRRRERRGGEREKRKSSKSKREEKEAK